MTENRARQRRIWPAALAALIPLLGWWLYQGEPRRAVAPPAPEITRDRVSYYLIDARLTATRADGPGLQRHRGADAPVR